MMNISDYEKTIKHQFDSFCKKVLRNRARTIYEENRRWQNRFIPLENLTPNDLSKLCRLDRYEVECIFLTVFDYEIPIENIRLAQAIESLSKIRHDIILLSFFLDMPIIDIARLMNRAKSTVQYHRKKLWTNYRNLWRNR